MLHPFTNKFLRGLVLAGEKGYVSLVAVWRIKGCPLIIGGIDEVSTGLIIGIKEFETASFVHCPHA